CKWRRWRARVTRLRWRRHYSRRNSPPSCCRPALAVIIACESDLIRTHNPPISPGRSLRVKVSKPSPGVDARRSTGAGDRGQRSQFIRHSAESLTRKWRILLSFLAGVLLALAFPNFNLPLLAWIAIAVLI